MYEARHNVKVTYPNGRSKNYKAYAVWPSTKRYTWCNTRGVRSYVLLRHGFSVEVTNIPVR